jgi:CHAT domain-containing protein
MPIDSIVKKPLFGFTARHMLRIHVPVMFGQVSNQELYEILLQESFDLRKHLLLIRARITQENLPRHTMKPQYAIRRDIQTLLTALLCIIALTSWMSAAAQGLSEAACPVNATSSSETTLQWIFIDPRNGALVLQSEVIARLRFKDAEAILEDRQRPSIQFSTIDFYSDQDLIKLKEVTKVPLSSSCELSISGEAHLIIAPELLLQASAWLLLGTNVNDTDDAVSIELNADHAAQAFGLIANSTCCESALLQIGGLSIERLLDANNVKKASEIFQRLLLSDWQQIPSQNPSRIKFLIAEARLLSFLERRREALDLRYSLQDLVAASFGIASDEYLDNEMRIANLKLELGDYSSARTELEELISALRFKRSVSDPILFHTVLGLSNALALLGSDRESLDLLVNFKTELEARIGHQNRRVANLRSQIARIYIRLGQFELAIQEVAETFIWQKYALGIDNPDSLETTWLLARLFKDLGRLSTARTLLYALLDEIDHQDFLTTRNLRLKALGTLGSIEAAEGNLASAETTWQEVADQYLLQTNSKSEDVIGANMNYALIAILNGKKQKACETWSRENSQWLSELHLNGHLEAFSNILTGFCAVLQSRSPSATGIGLTNLESALALLQDLDGVDSDSVIFALSMQARAHLEAGDRFAAKQNLRDLVAKAERRRANAIEGSLTRESWLSTWVSERSNLIGYRTLALLLAEDGETGEALRVSDLSRGRKLIDRIAGNLADCNRKLNVNEEELDRTTKLTENLEERIASSEDILERVELESKRILTVRARAQILFGLGNKQTCAKVENATGFPEFSFDSIPKGTALISVQHSGAKWWAIIVTADRSLQIIWLDSNIDLGQLALAWLYSLRQDTIRAWGVEGGDIALSYSRPATAIGKSWSEKKLRGVLSQFFLSPIIRAVPRAKNLIFVADDEFVALPLGMLSHAGGFAIQRFCIAFAPSVSAYLESSRTKKQESWQKDLLAFATADSNPGDERLEHLSSTGSKDQLTREIVKFLKARPLRFAVPEVKEVAENFLSSRTELLIDAAAEKSSLLMDSKGGALRDFRYVHFALHFYFSAYAPEKSMLLFSPVGTSGLHDFGLTAAELAHLKMRGELVVFSGCSTALGPNEPGQGLLGLAYASIVAGNKSALLTLWQVADDLAERFMVHFYRKLRTGVLPTEALASTQSSLISGEDLRMRDPSIWAAFILIGTQ